MNMIDNMVMLEGRRKRRGKVATPATGHRNLISLKGDLHALIHAMKVDTYLRASNWQIRSIENTLADIEEQLNNRKGHGHDQRN